MAACGSSVAPHWGTSSVHMVKPAFPAYDSIFFVNWCKHLQEDCKIHASLTKHGELRTRPSQVGAIAWRLGGWNGWEMPCYWGDDEGWNLSSLTDRRFNYIHLRFVSRNEEVLRSATTKSCLPPFDDFFRATSTCYLYKVVQNIPILNPSAVDSWGLFHLAALGRAWPSLACPKLCFVLPTRTIVTHFDPCNSFLLQALNHSCWATVWCRTSSMLGGMFGDDIGVVWEWLLGSWITKISLSTSFHFGSLNQFNQWSTISYGGVDFINFQRPRPKIRRSGKLHNAGCNLCEHPMMSRPKDLCLETLCFLLPWFTLRHLVNNSNTNASACSLLHVKTQFPTASATERYFEEPAAVTTFSVATAPT